MLSDVFRSAGWIFFCLSETRILRNEAIFHEGVSFFFKFCKQTFINLNIRKRLKRMEDGAKRDVAPQRINTSELFISWQIISAGSSSVLFTAVLQPQPGPGLING